MIQYDNNTNSNFHIERWIAVMPHKKTSWIKRKFTKIHFSNRYRGKNDSRRRSISYFCLSVRLKISSQCKIFFLELSQKTREANHQARPDCIIHFSNEYWVSSFQLLLKFNRKRIILQSVDLEPRKGEIRKCTRVQGSLGRRQGSLGRRLWSLKTPFPSSKSTETSLFSSRTIVFGEQIFGVKTISLRTKTRNLEIPDGEDVDVLRRPGPQPLDRLWNHKMLWKPLIWLFISDMERDLDQKGL